MLIFYVIKMISTNFVTKVILDSSDSGAVMMEAATDSCRRCSFDIVKHIP